MGGEFDYRNNAIFNWRPRTMDGGDETSMINVINNHYKPGLATNPNILRAMKERLGVAGEQDSNEPLLLSPFPPGKQTCSNPTKNFFGSSNPCWRWRDGRGADVDDGHVSHGEERPQRAGADLREPVMKRRRFGRNVYAVGGNVERAEREPHQAAGTRWAVCCRVLRDCW